jgi:hypothetical protein
VDVVVGVAETPIDLTLTASNQAATGTATTISIGEDSTSAANAAFAGGGARNGSTTDALYQVLTGRLVKYPAVGRHFYAWLEASVASGTTTWYGTPAMALSMAGTANGLAGWIEG